VVASQAATSGVTNNYRHRCQGSIGDVMAKRSRLVSGLCIGCTILIASQSWAATVVPTTGDLSINQGQGFKPVKKRVEANVGDSIMVGPGGAATVVYGDGCKVNVQPGAVTTIAPLSPCASGSNAQDRDCRPDQPQNCGWTTDTLLTLLLFGGLAGGIAYLVTTVNHNPASP
jgi:hypothetical protein